jgi:hypothetical protein
VDGRIARVVSQSGAHRSAALCRSAGCRCGELLTGPAARSGCCRLAGVGGGVSWGRVGSHTQLRVLAALNAARGGGLAAHAVVYACASPALVYEVQPCHPGLARATRRDEPRGQASSLQGAKRVSAALGARKCKRKCAMETEAADMEDAAAMEVLWLLQTGNSTAKKAKVSRGKGTAVCVCVCVCARESQRTVRA